MLQRASTGCAGFRGPFVCLLVELAEGGFLVQKKKQGQVQKKEPASAGPLEVHNMAHDKPESETSQGNLARAGGVVVPQYAEQAGKGPATVPEDPQQVMAHCLQALLCFPRSGWEFCFAGSASFACFAGREIVFEIAEGQQSDGVLGEAQLVQVVGRSRSSSFPISTEKLKYI